MASVAQIVRGNVNVVTTVSSSQQNNNSNNLSGGNIVNSSMNAPTTVLPVAKVLPQQQQNISNDGPSPSIVAVSSSVSGVAGQSVFIHSRSPSNPATATVVANNTVSMNLTGNSQAASFISTASGAYYMPTSVHSGTNNSSGNIAVNTALQSITTAASNVTTNATSSTTTISVPNQIINAGTPVTSLAYAPQAGSFAVVPASNRNSSQIHGN